MKAGLGDHVKDPITGFEGIITSRIDHLNGCIRLGVQRRLKKSESAKELGELIQYFDIDQVDVIKAQAFQLAKKQTGGPEARPRDLERPR